VPQAETPAGKMPEVEMPEAKRQTS